MANVNPYLEEANAFNGFKASLELDNDAMQYRTTEGIVNFMHRQKEEEAKKFESLWREKLIDHQKNMERKMLYGLDPMQDPAALDDMKRKLAEYVEKQEEGGKKGWEQDQEMWEKFVRDKEQPDAQDLDELLDTIFTNRSKGTEMSFGRFKKLMDAKHIENIYTDTYRVKQTFKQVIMDNDGSHNEIIFHSGIVFKIVEKDESNGVYYVVKVGSAYGEGDGIPKEANPYE